MRKKFLNVMVVTALSVCLAGSALAGCGKKNEKEVSTANKEITADQYAATVTDNAAVYKKLFTMPEYKGVSVDMDLSTYAVTEDVISDYIKSALESTATTDKLTEGTTAEGDAIVLDYAGTINGEAFSGGTATDVSYTIGSGKFIEDLDKGLVGLEVGKEVEIPCKFPESYSADLAGKDVIFTVTVKEIDKQVIPELTDDWVTENKEAMGLTDESVKDVATFKAYVKKNLEETNEANKQSAIFDAAYAKIIEGLNVEKYPEDELKDLLKTLNENVENEFKNYGSYYGSTSLEDYLKNVYGFETKDAFNEYADSYAKEYLLQKMIVTIIAADNEIVVSAEDINAKGEELASYYGYANFQEILDSYGNAMNAEIGYQVLYQKVIEFVIANSKVNNTASK